MDRDSHFQFKPALATRWEQPNRYSNPQLDALLNDAASDPDIAARRADYDQAQQILARDLPSINLRYLDSVVVHNRRLTNVIPSPSGSYRFLETATLGGD